MATATAPLAKLREFDASRYSIYIILVVVCIAAAFLPKPFSLPQLAAKVKEQLAA